MKVCVQSQAVKRSRLMDQSRRVPDALDSAMQALESVAGEGGDALTRCQAHASVAACWLEREDVVQAEWHWQQALRWARLHGDLSIELDMLNAAAATTFRVAQRHECVGDHGQSRMALNRARDTCFEGVQLVPSLPSLAARAQALCQLAAVLHDCGDTDDAQTLHAQAHALRRASAN